MTNGTIKLFDYKGTPIYVHWSVLLFGLFLIDRPDPLITIPMGLLGYLIIIVVHEVGHAFFVNRYGYGVMSIVIYGLNGICIYDAGNEQGRRILIPAGGIIFQSFLFVLGILLFYLFSDPPSTVFSKASLMLAKFFVFVNLLIIILNLLPIKGLDGYDICRAAKSKVSG